MTQGRREPTGRLGEMVRYQQSRRDEFRRLLQRYEPGPLDVAGHHGHADGSGRHRFLEALLAARRREEPSRIPVIAEVKRRSPSAGIIAAHRDAVEQAAHYARGGAAAVSVLANEAFFGGSPEDVRAVSSSAEVGVPVLFKDIVVCREQVELAHRCGASAVLLIMAALSPEGVEELADEARGLGLDVVVEVHDEAELERALDVPQVRIIGINNRDLRTFEVDARRALKLLPKVPPGILRVAESGYRTPDELAEAWAAGADAVLVGEALMRSSDPQAFLAEARRRWERLGSAVGSGGKP